MVGREIGDHRDVRPAMHAVELEGAELQHDDVVLFDLRDLAQERVADIAAEVDAIPGLFQKFGDDGGGGGLPVAAGDGDHLAGAESQEHLHLGGEQAAARLCRSKMYVKGHEARRAEEDIVIQALEIVGPELELHAQRLEPIGLRAHLLTRAHIAGRHVAAASGEQFDQRQVAHADADGGDPLAPDAVHIFG